MLRTTLQSWDFFKLEPETGFEQVYRKPFPTLPASVPGMVHLDLARNGLIPEPLYGRAHLALEWVDECDWAYRTEFSADPKAFSNSIIRFECLDGIACIELNGVQVGHHDNAFLPIEIDVSNVLRESNVLEIRFESSSRAATERRNAYLLERGLPLDQRCFDERAFLRKPAYMWGWDWAPRLISCGIAGPVELIQFESRIAHLELQIEPQEDGKYLVSATAHCMGTTAELELILGESGRASQQTECTWLIEGGEWHPKGCGPQTIHSIKATAGDDSEERRFGLRRVSLNRQPDAYGESFQFEVNGQPIWARGANWIPPSFFYSPGPAHSEIDRRVSQLAELGFNMLRVWGGGRYECEAFYDACDRHGILVWQDFPFACMYYPDDAQWQDAIRLEASHHVERLRTHPSLALWCGNNECQTMHESWLGENAASRFHGERIYSGVLKEVLTKLDQASPYIPTSPTGSDPTGPPNCNNPSFGDCHYWEVWHGKGDWIHYRDVEPRFCAEFGFASPCSMATWVKSISKEDIESFPGPEFLAHDKTGKDFEIIRGLVELHYPRAETLEEWVYFAQLNQRDAIRCAIEHFRSCPACAGALVWQANDCWPGSTWSICDSLGVIKPAGFELERLFAEALIAASFDSCELAARIVGKFDGQLSVRRFDTLTGAELNPSEFTESELHRSAFLAGAEGLQPRWCFAVEPKDLALQCQPIEVSRKEFLEVRVSGFVADLVAYGADSFEPLLLQGQRHRGAKPVTAVNEVLTYLAPSANERVVFRSLAGVHEVRAAD